MHEERLLGIFTERDILRALQYEPHKVLDSPVKDWMTPDPITVESALPVAEAATVMLRGGFRHLPVVAGGSVVGIVSLRDLVRSLVEG
jgi:CBS domain-containing protein